MLWVLHAVFAYLRNLSCTADLTPSMHVGHEQVEQVLHAVFAYLSMLRAPGGITEDRFQENRALSELRFRLADKSSPYSYVERISSAMQTYEDR